LVEFGASDHDSMQALHRVAGAVVLNNGRIVVAHSPTPMVRWYSANGGFLYGTGRPGGGPGEFGGGENAWIARLWPLPADSVATWEHSARRMQVFDPAGRYARSVTLELPPRMHQLAYPHIVGRWRTGFVAFLSSPFQTGTLWEVTRDTFAYLRYDSSGRYLDVLARLPGWTMVTVEDRVRGRTMRSMGRLPFATNAVTWVHGDRFYYGPADRFEIVVFDSAGKLHQLIRRREGQRLLSAQVIAAYKANRLATMPPGPARGQAERTFEQMPFPDSLPAYRRIMVDREGALWVQEYDLPGAASVTWSVFDRAGIWLTNVEIPQTLEVRDIGRDYILVQVRDELDIEHIRRYALLGRN
jgi:hypothetical protein